LCKLCNFPYLLKYYLLLADISLSRRKNPARINEDSIMNWARLLFGKMSEEEFRWDIYFVEVGV
jgi:hypothetical protein